MRECITIQSDPTITTYLTDATNDGYDYIKSLTPFRPTGFLRHAPFVDAGPSNQGTLFKFSFGKLNAGQSRTFNMYYGATANKAEAEAAMQAIGAQVYGFAKPSSPGGQCLDDSNVFIIAFTGVDVA